VQSSSGKPKVTVYIPCHNYGRFLPQSIESVLAQSSADWELIIIDDGSSDDTESVANQYASQRSDKIRVFRHSRAEGLRACANLALKAAHGDYIMRLDADDFLDESALLVLGDYLDRHPEVALVYPNYVYVDEDGMLLGLESRKKIGTEAKLLDLPAHGAGTMIRRRVLKSIGGYDERYNAQDGHELWLKILHRYQIANVSTPLFFYRQHKRAASCDEERLLSARKGIKQGLTEKNGKVRPRVVAIVPARNITATIPNIVLEKFAGRPLIDYTIEAARASRRFEKIFVTTDDARVFEYCSGHQDILVSMRPMDLSLPETQISQVLYEAVGSLEKKHEIYPDILVLLNVHCPLRRAEHIGEAIDTLELYNVDNVISVHHCDDVHFVHGAQGLQPINRGMLQRMRLERETLYIDNRAINAFWRDIVTDKTYFGSKIGHVLMTCQESLRIRTPLEASMVEKLLSNGVEATVKPIVAKSS